MTPSVTRASKVQPYSFSLGAALLGSVAAGLALSVNAQEGPRTVTTASIASEIELNDNYDLRTNSLGDAVLWNTTIGAGLQTRSRVDELRFNVTGLARVADLPVTGSETSFDNPTAALTYGRTVDDSNVALFATGQRSDVEFFDPLSDIDDDGNFDDTTGTGTRTSVRTGVTFQLNGDGPVSLNGAGRLDDITFSDTTDPDLNDRRNSSLSAQVGFRVSPILRLTTGASIAREDIDDANQTNRDSRRADVGFIGQLNQRATVTARIGYSQVETDRIGESRETEESVVGDVALNFAERRGATRLSFSSTLDENGERYTLSYGKSVNWDNAVLDATVGLSTNADTDLRAIGNISYSLTGRDTQLTLGLRQVATTDEDGRNVLNSGASVQLNRSLTRTASVGLAVDGGLTRIDSGDGENSERLTASARYNHALTEDWSANFGYRYRYRKSENDPSAESNALFFGVARQFQASR